MVCFLDFVGVCLKKRPTFDIRNVGKGLFHLFVKISVNNVRIRLILQFKVHLSLRADSCLVLYHFSTFFFSVSTFIFINNSLIISYYIHM